LLAWDLSADPTELATLDAATIRQRLFTRTAELPEGVTRLPVKSVHLNKSPMVVGNLRTLSPQMADRWRIDMNEAMRHAERAAGLPDMSAIWPEVFARPKEAAPDVDEDLYGGFVGNADRRRLEHLRGLPPTELARARTGFDDPRLEELLFRFRARNHPDTLDEDEAGRWEAHRAARLLEGEGGARNVDSYFAEIDQLAQAAEDDERVEGILSALYDYAEAITPSA